MIAVVGATGNTGLAVVKELRALGEDPLCIVRNVGKAREVLGVDARTAVAEIADRAALEKALRGVKRVLVVTGHNPQTGDHQINILEACKAAGVEFFAKVSSGRAVVGPDAESVIGRCQHAVEEAMKRSGLAWVILRPGFFMQNVLAQAHSIKSEGRMVLAYPQDQPIAFIDVRDTGAVGARILREPDRHAGRTYAFTGATSSLGEFAKVLSEVLGRPVTYVGASLEQTERSMRARGMPDWLVTHALAMGRAGANGAFANESTQPIREIVGRPPLTIREFVEAHKAAFI
jgi:NAD(P)H dehydrogenase (quinone)